MNKVQIIYILIAVAVIILEGPLWYKYWPGNGKHEKIFGFKDVKSHKFAYFKQTLINTLGAIIGWGIGYYLLTELVIQGRAIEWVDLALIIVAYSGMVGQLPNMVINNLEKFAKLLNK